MEEKTESSIIALTKKFPALGYHIDVEYDEDEEYEYEYEDYDEDGEEITEVVEAKILKFNEDKKKRKKRYLKQCVDYIFSEQSISDAKIDNRAADNRSSKNKKKNVLSLILTVIFAIGFIGVCALLVAHCNKCRGSSVSWLGSYGVGILYILLGAVCLALCFFSFMQLTSNKVLHKSDNEYSQSIREFIDNIQEIRSSVTEQKNSLNNKTLPIKECCKELYSTLQKQYSSLLDVRDWKHLDLVIFYFETRRADSVKESLQLVDKEMQTRRIVKTIQEASEQICSTIRDGFVTLNNNITNCFTALSNQLASQHSRNLALLQGLTTSVNLNNALQAKANKTSEQLMDDVKHIRNYVFN